KLNDERSLLREIALRPTMVMLPSLLIEFFMGCLLPVACCQLPVVCLPVGCELRVAGCEPGNGQQATGNYQLCFLRCSILSSCWINPSRTVTMRLACCAMSGS